MALAVATVLKAERKRHGYTQEHIESATGGRVTQSAISRAESGKRAYDLPQLVLIVAALDVRLSTVFRQAEWMMEGWESDRAHGIPSPLDTLRGHDAVTASDSAGHARTGA